MTTRAKKVFSRSGVAFGAGKGKHRTRTMGLPSFIKEGGSRKNKHSDNNSYKKVEMGRSQSFITKECDKHSKEGGDVWLRTKKKNPN